MVVVDGAKTEQLGGPGMIVDIERAYLHAEKFTDPVNMIAVKPKRATEECIIFMERESTAYSIVRINAFDRNTVAYAIAHVVRDG